MKTVFRWVLLGILPLSIAGCFDDDSELDLGSVFNCSEAYQKDYVYSTMQEWYYWYNEMPAINPQDYSTPEDVLEAVRYKAFDTTFSYITSQEAEQAFFDNAAYVGFGFSTVIVNGDELFLREVFDGSPAGHAGLMRGDQVLEIDGVAVSTLIAAGTLDDAYGDREVGVTKSFLVRHADTSEEKIDVTKEEVTIPVVSATTTFDVNGNTVGYLFFRSFNNAAYDALDDAFADFAAAGVTQLVLDLRYNGGGLLAVAEHLGGLIAGSTHPGELLVELNFNDKKQSNNVILRLSELANSIEITDMVAITTESSASASEMIINGLEPYFTARMHTVGSNTFGKPVGQSGFEYCDDVLRAVTFETINVNGIGGYFNGIAPTCAANDDLSETLGSAGEDSIAEALHLLETGSCSGTVTKAAAHIAEQKALAPNRMQVRDGWDVVTGGAR